MRRRICAVLASIVVLACHQQSPEQASARSARNVITQAEIDSARASNVYDLIARLRADFLRDRGTVSIKTNTHERAVVFVNDQEYGIPETLRNLLPSRFSEIRFFSGTDAVIKFGAQYGGGVIQLISRVE
jgi:hypothetical protein